MRVYGLDLVYTEYGPWQVLLNTLMDLRIQYNSKNILIIGTFIILGDCCVKSVPHCLQSTAKMC
jgi:hypothetical protein